MQMRRLILVVLVLVLAVPAAAGALMRGPGDGTLVVDNGRGIVLIQARGGILGRFDSGRMVVEDPNPGDGSGPVVYGAQRIRELGATRTLYIGTDVRFRLIGGLWRVRIDALGTDVSAVGRGTATLDGSRYSQVGRYSVNGGPMQPFPIVPTTFQLGAPGPPPATVGPKDKEK
jgi:hypothetical protein